MPSQPGRCLETGCLAAGSLSRALLFTAMPDMSFLAATRDSYDDTVVEYTEMVAGILDAKPLDRALLGVFAELVRAGGNGPIADVGCGPGRITIFLHRLGMDAFGIDLSPGMIAHARRTYPDLRFDVGSMLALDLPDASLGGLLAYYSIIHVPRERRPEVFAEFYRVLAPGGHLMLAFQIGNETMHRDEIFDKPICLDWYRQQPDEVVQLLREAGFQSWTTTVREREDPESAPQGYLLATKPGAPAP
jgi:ubiquinone/menaquinone biosynthesis C-methylase UbiE